VGDKDEGSAIVDETLSATKALALKQGIPDREDFIDEQKVRIDVGGDREPQTHIHAGRVPFDRMSIKRPMLAKSTILSNRAFTSRRDSPCTEPLR
jgi:hypothetical protein